MPGGRCTDSRGSAEVNFRTLCDLIRYRYFKSAGLVNSVEEFLALAHPGERTDLKEEEPR